MLTILGRRYLVPFKKYRVSDLQVYEPATPPVDPKTCRAKLSAAVIDDQYFTPLENLRLQGFNIVHIGNANSPAAVVNFDIVVSDIRGVATEYGHDLEGGALIKSINEMYPEKYIIAYSGQFDRSHRAAMAKEYSHTSMSKSSSTAQWTEALDEAIQWLLNPAEQWKIMQLKLTRTGANNDTIALSENSFVRSILVPNKKALEQLANSNRLTDDVRSIVRSLVTSAIWAMITGIPK